MTNPPNEPTPDPYPTDQIEKTLIDIDTLMPLPDPESVRAVSIHEGCAPVIAFRCLNCLTIPIQNRNEHSGGECGGCIAKERDELSQRLATETEARQVAEKEFADLERWLSGDQSYPVSGRAKFVAERRLADSASLRAQVVTLQARVVELERENATEREQLAAIRESSQNLAAYAEDGLYFSLPMSGNHITVRDAISSLREELVNAAEHLNEVYRKLEATECKSKERFERIDRLTQQLAACEKQWRPIAEAPKDGTEFLAVVILDANMEDRAELKIAIGCWDSALGCFGLVDATGNGYGADEEFFYWQPLLQPPSDAAMSPDTHGGKAMTIADLSKLSDEELNKSLAECLGWQRLPESEGWAKAVRETHMLTSDGLNIASPPRYSTDLNTVAAVEAGLTGMGMPLFQQAAAYHSNLIDVCITTEPKCLPTFATAKQRTIALILTLTP